MAGEDKTATEKVADDDLSKAWGDVSEEEKAEETKEEETKPETEDKKPPEKPEGSKASAESKDDEDGLDHKESSKIGRKLKGLYDKVNTLTSELESLRKPKPEQEIEVPEVISTPEDVDKYLAARSQKLQREQQDYEKSYLGQVQQLSAKTDDEELHEEIVAEMMQSFNVKHTNNAFADARVNYAEAKASLLSKKISGKKKVPDRDTADAPPIQPAASATRTVAKTISLPSLDAAATDYVGYLRKRGMSDEDIAKELA